MKPMVDRLNNMLNECMTVSCLHEIFQALMDEDYGDSVVAFQLGEVSGESKALFNMPVADVCAASDKSFVFLTPWGRPDDEDDKALKPKLSVSFTDDAISLCIEDNNAETEGEANHV